jgi:anthranilate synthase component II
VDLLLLDNYDSFTFNLYHYLLLGGAKRVEVVRNDQITLKQVANFDAIVLSPGPGLPMDAGLMPEIVANFVTKKPFLGVCLGHQALGQFFGANLRNLNSIYHGVARNTNIVKDGFLYHDLPSSFLSARYHSWGFYKDDFPKCLEITALDEKNVVMSFQHLSLPVTGVQYHPESILTEHGHKILDNWISFAQNWKGDLTAVSASKE